MTTLFVSPHFDDVVLSCVAHVVEARRQGRVVVATAWGGNQGERAQEDARALAVLDVEARALPFLDAPERLGIVPGFASLMLSRYHQEGADLRCLGASLTALVDELDVAQVYLPLGVGEHVDHRIVHAAHEQLPPGLSVSFYEDQPYARVRGALGARLMTLAAHIREEAHQPLTLMPPVRPTLAEIHRSAQSVFGPLVAASSSPPQATSELAAVARRLASRLDQAPPAPRLHLLPRCLPSCPELTLRALRCYESQGPLLFGTTQALRDFVDGAPSEASYQKL